jgi:hypothetical protein
MKKGELYKEAILGDDFRGAFSHAIRDLKTHHEKYIRFFTAH